MMPDLTANYKFYNYDIKHNIIIIAGQKKKFLHCSS